VQFLGSSYFHWLPVANVLLSVVQGFSSKTPFCGDDDTDKVLVVLDDLRFPGKWRIEKQRDSRGFGEESHLGRHEERDERVAEIYEGTMDR
jgi:hypothetical protein